MYNRYIPQADGTHRRNRVQDMPPRQASRPTPPPPPRQEQEKPCDTPCKEDVTPSLPAPPECQKCQRQPDCHGSSLSGFLNQLLPRNLDTGDLIVVLLLLLLAGDCEADRSTALLTLVLYLFM